MVNLQPGRALASDAFSRFCRGAASAHAVIATLQICTAATICNNTYRAWFKPDPMRYNARPDDQHHKKK
jgi:hypothetical protein